MGAGGTAMGGEFTLTSSELEDGGEFMDKHTCTLNGFDNDESPPLAWSGAPQGTMSFAITFLDVTLTDAGNMNGYHSVIWDIPASVSELPANFPTGATITDPVSAKQFNPLSASYLGPCPNIGGGSNVDTYEFTIHAMPEAETASIAAASNVQQMVTAIEEVSLGSATLSGTSDASPP
jgi:Raf kinase inhibitor-like YbhB/YbcL family protein